MLWGCEPQWELWEQVWTFLLPLSADEEFFLRGEDDMALQTSLECYMRQGLHGKQSAALNVPVLFAADVAPSPGKGSSRVGTS